MQPLQSSILERLLVLYARRFPIRRGKLRVINSIWRAVLNSPETYRVAHLKYGGFKLPCDLREMLQRQLYFFGTYFVEEAILNCWQKAARRSKVIFDVGANAGIFSLAALAVQTNARVYAFEPTPEIVHRLRNTVEINGLDHLYIHEVAISKKNGLLALCRFRGETGENEGMNFVKSVNGGTNEQLVHAVCLDSFCQEHRIDYVDLLKLDIQGNEPQALAGAKGLLTSGRIGTIFTELNWGQDTDSVCPATETINILEQAGYRFAKPATHLYWKKSGEWLRSLSDVIARRESSREDSRCR